MFVHRQNSQLRLALPVVDLFRLQLTNGDRARNVIQRVLRKNLIDGDPNNFVLLQVIPQSSKEARFLLALAVLEG